MNPLPITHGGEFLRPLRVCFALPEFLGFPSRGGIGQAYGAFVSALVSAGHDVTVLVPDTPCPLECSTTEVAAKAKAEGVRLVFLPPLPFRCVSTRTGSDQALLCYRAWYWLKDQDFEVIHFTGWETLGYYCVSAKKCGQAFPNTLLCVSLRSPSRWCREGDEQEVENLAMMETDFLEQRTTELADLVFAPSHHIAEWAEAKGWDLPGPVFHQPNLIQIPEFSLPPPESAPIREIVFFGRIQPRKGLFEFCDAIDLLTAKQLSGLTITFLGAHVTSPVDSRAYVNEKAAGWPCQTTILDWFSREEALTYLRRPGVLAVIPSRIESFCNTVYECQNLGIPFLAAHTKGLLELIRLEDIPHVLFDLTPRALAEKLGEALISPPAPVPSRHDSPAAKNHWVRWHNHLTDHPPDLFSPLPPGEIAKTPRVTVCVPHFNQPKLLLEALKSLEAQTYPNFEVIIVDDGSTSPEVPEFLDHLEKQIAPRGWRVLRQSNQYVGAARNHAAREAQGEFLLFMDDDNIAKASELEAFVRAALHSGLDVITCPMECFRESETTPPDGPSERWIHLFLGGPTGSGLFENSQGDANFFIRKSVFLKLGGFIEIMNHLSEDRHFLIKTGFAGHSILLLPEPQYEYRIRSESMFRALPQSRQDRVVLDAFEAVTPAAMHDTLAMALSLHKADLSRPKIEPDVSATGLQSRQTVINTSASRHDISLHFGEGWHEDEGDHCWTGHGGPAACFLIHVQGPAIPVSFSAHIIAHDPDNRLQIMWNGKILAQTWDRTDLSIEGLETRSGVNELRFVAEKPVVESSASDPRKLGHCFSKISLSPSKPDSRQRIVPDLMMGPPALERTILLNELPAFGAEAAFGEGWYPDEGFCRWSGREGPKSSILFETSLSMTIRFRAKVTWSAPESFCSVTFQGKILCPRFRGQNLDFILELEPGVSKCLEFATDSHPTQPINSIDRRHLSFAFSEIQLTIARRT